jgi:hypothetical protein
MAAAANRFLQTLDQPLRSKISYRLTDPERQAWTNLPAAPDAGGVTLGELNQEQAEAALNLLATLFSSQGYEKIRNIMLADDQLLPNGRPRPGFGTATFALVVFGEPSDAEPWAFQLDGHHLGVNVALDRDDITLSPSFIGTQPESFRIGDVTLRPLSGEIELAFKLANSLTDDQVRQAILQPQRGQLITGPGNDRRVPPAQGASCQTFDPDQKKLLLSLVAEWVNNLPEPYSRRRMEQLAAETDQMHFAWFGPKQPGSDVSFRIQGPTLIIEYAGQDLGGDPTNHLHTMYRDPTREYGNQLK